MLVRVHLSSTGWPRTGRADDADGPPAGPSVPSLGCQFASRARAPQGEVKGDRRAAERTLEAAGRGHTCQPEWNGPRASGPGLTQRLFLVLRTSAGPV